MIASITCFGLCVVAELSKYIRGLPSIFLFRMGNCCRIFSISFFVMLVV